MSTSVVRIVWAGIRAKPVMTGLFALCLGGMWIGVIFELLAKPADLSTLTHSLMMAAWMAGLGVSQVATTLLPLWQTDPAGRPAATIERTRSWLRSEDPTFVDLSGT